MIEVGKGHSVGDQPIMSWKDPEPFSVHAFTVSSGFGSDGRYEFNTYEGKGQ